MHLYLTRSEAVEREILKPLAEGLEDLLSDPRADGGPRLDVAHVTVRSGMPACTPHV